MSQNVITKSNVKSEGNKSVLKSAQRLVLAFQHLIAMFGATVLVPILTGFDPSIALIAAGCGTLIFHLCTKGKVPVFLGSSFAFIPVIISVTELHNGDLRYAQGGIVIAGLIYVIISFFVHKVGVNNIRKFLPAQVVGPMIISIGLNLIPTAYGMASENLIIAAITLSIALIITLFSKGFIKQLSILLAVTIGYLVSLKLGIVNTSLISEAPLLSIPNFTLPRFDFSSVAVIAPVVIFSSINGACWRYYYKWSSSWQKFIEDPGLNRTLLGDGLATVFSAFIGGPANTTYGENTGVLAITKNYDPSIIRLTAVLAIVLGVVAKIGGFLQSIPSAVMGGISLMLFSMIALIGFKTIKNEKVIFNIKNVLIMSVILILGIGTGLIEKKFGFTLGIPVTETVKISGVSLAAISGVALNAILNRKEIK